MKRFRDDAYANPPFKRPTSRGESNGPPNPTVSNGGGAGGGGCIVNGGGVGNGGGISVAASGTQKLTTNDALTYLKEVKDMFQGQKEKYDRFLDIMKDFKAQRVDTSGVIGRVKELFKGLPNLILGFNTFLPKGYEITLTDVDEVPPRKAVEFEEAISFVNKIKRRFQNDDHVYKSFLDILNMYRKDHKGITEVYQEVASLFDAHPDLLDEFTRFLPNNSSATAIPSAPHASLGHNSFHCGDERSSAVPLMRQSQMDKQQLHKDRIAGSHGERDHSVERPDPDDGKTFMKLQEQKKHMERENRDSKRNCDQDDKDHDNEDNGGIGIYKSSEKRKPALKVEDFGGSSNVALHDDKDAWKSMYRKEFHFFEKVKERLCSADDYQTFLKCINIYSKEIITRKELQSLVGDLIGKYNDLMDGFNEFLESCEGMDEFLAGVMGKKPIWTEGNSAKALKIEENEKESKREVVEGGKEKERCSLKYWEKSIQELDLSGCKRCAASYRLLPEDYPIPPASHRSELGAQVLNDHWVSVTSGSEDYSFKHMRRNQYEESLFRCEDDRFELDMLLESVRSTAKRAEEFLKANNKISSDDPIKIEEYFTALNLRCIERIYGDHGLDVMDILRKNASLALPAILIRLKQKQDEWSKCRLDFNKIWADIYSKNHYKSLDHRSFYFKQQDSKNLSAKALVTEIKEIKDKRQKEDEVFLSIAARNRHTFTPDLDFEYPDTEIHEDIYKIIKYSCEEICATKEQFGKVVHLWTTFLEPLLGVPSRPKGSSVSTEDNNDDASKHRLVKKTIMISGGSPNAKSNGNTDCSKSPQQMSFGHVGIKTVDGLPKEGPNVTYGEMIASFDIAVKSGSDAHHGESPFSSRVNNGHAETNGVKHTTEVMCSSEVPETLLSNKLISGGSSHTGNKDDFVGASKNEKEEGELSPNRDFEDNFGATYQNSVVSQEPPKKKHNAKHEMGALVQNGVDADNKDNENVSEAGEDASGRESAAADCSRNEEEDGKAESEGEGEDTSDGALPSQSECFLANCKPLSKYVASSSVGGKKRRGGIFYGSDAFYVLLRLHQALYERILTAKVNSVSSESKRKMNEENSDPYARFMSALFSLLDGSSDNSKYEDDCRLLIGNQSYVLFTLDKLIYKLVKQLQTVSSDEMDCKLLQLYEYESSRKPEKFVDSVYYENAHVLLHDENIYRLECTPSPSRLTMQLMDDGSDMSETIAASIDPNFVSYLHNEYLLVDHREKESSKIMLKRNLQKYANLDESIALYTATENTLIMNGLECKMSTTTFKISYVLDTEDLFIRLGRRRENRPIGKLTRSGQRKVQKFNQFLAASL